MRAVVVDASALVELLLGTERGGGVASLARDPEVDLHVPELCDVEVLAALRRLWLQDRMEEGRFREALEDLVDLRLFRHSHLPFLGRIFGLRENFSAYDAAYVALAEALEGELLTADERLGRAAREHTRIPLLPRG